MTLIKIPQNIHLWIIMILAIVVISVILFVPYFTTKENKQKYVESFVGTSPSTCSNATSIPTLENGYCSKLTGNTVKEYKTVQLGDSSCVNLQYCEPQPGVTVSGLQNLQYFYGDNYNNIQSNDLINLTSVKKVLKNINDCSSKGQSKFVINQNGSYCNQLKKCGTGSPVYKNDGIAPYCKTNKNVCSGDDTYNTSSKKCIKSKLNDFDCQYGGNISFNTKKNPVCTRTLTCASGDIVTYDDKNKSLTCISSAKCKKGVRISDNTCGVSPNCGDVHLDGTICKNDITCGAGGVLLKNAKGEYVKDDATGLPICQFKY